MNQMNQMDCCTGMNIATMGWGMGIIGILLLILILLGIAAPVKYLFFGKPKPAKPERPV
jgi:hypothetical protein